MNICEEKKKKIIVISPTRQGLCPFFVSSPRTPRNIEGFLQTLPDKLPEIELGTFFDDVDSANLNKDLAESKLHTKKERNRRRKRMRAEIELQRYMKWSLEFEEIQSQKPPLTKAKREALIRQVKDCMREMIWNPTNFRQKSLVQKVKRVPVHNEEKKKNNNNFVDSDGCSGKTSSGNSMHKKGQRRGKPKMKIDQGTKEQDL